MYDLVCLSHSRWDFVFQRPQHLMTRCSKHRNVYFVEECLPTDRPSFMASHQGGPNLEVLTPMVSRDLSPEETENTYLTLLERAIANRELAQYVLWFDTPMPVRAARVLDPIAVVYDCVDEPSVSRGAPRALAPREKELLAQADVVFAGGHALFEAKNRQHPNVHAFPNGVDVTHFAAARAITDDPPDQAKIPVPRFGFCGAIDERMNLSLLEAIAKARPRWHFVMIGPVVRLDERDLPRLPNVHYVGPKPYAELPRYFSGWDVAIMPFAKNRATRYSNPTKTPEYLAAGAPVVSTSIQDVVHTYAERGLCHIADTAEEFLLACERALLEKNWASRLQKTDAFLAEMSWDEIWTQMEHLMNTAVREHRAAERRHSAGPTASLSSAPSSPSWAR